MHVCFVRGQRQPQITLSVDNMLSRGHTEDHSRDRAGQALLFRQLGQGAGLGLNDGKGFRRNGPEL